MGTVSVPDEPAPPGARPLYLMSTEACLVDVEGPALAVRRKHRARGLFPLGRISRVVSAASVQWRSRALTSCLERGIPIVLLGRNGCPSGYVQPACVARSSLAERLCEVLERHHWQHHFDNWLSAERMRIVRSWAAARAEAGEVMAEPRRRDIVRRFVYAPGWQQLLAELPGIYHAALLALTCERMKAAGLAATYFGVGAELHLADAVCNLLCLALALELEGLGQVVQADVRARLLIVETYTRGLEERCSSILVRLDRRLTELQREWH